MSSDYDFGLIAVTLEAGVATAVITAPPMNVMTAELFKQMREFCTRIDADDAVRVVVFRSGDPDFFLAHFDVNVILEGISGPRTPENRLNAFQQLCERIQASPKISIAEIAGRVGGGGSEFCAACDMRFGAVGQTVINQMEVPLGILPGGGGTQRLPRLLGRGRALEMILGADDIDAETAERWGYLNRALPPDQLSPFVSGLAKRIAGFPSEALTLAKKSVLNSETLPMQQALLVEAALFEDVSRTSGVEARMRSFLEQGGQVREKELRIAQFLTTLSAD